MKPIGYVILNKIGNTIHPTGNNTHKSCKIYMSEKRAASSLKASLGEHRSHHKRVEPVYTRSEVGTLVRYIRMLADGDTWQIDDMLDFLRAADFGDGDVYTEDEE